MTPSNLIVLFPILIVCWPGYWWIRMRVQLSRLQTETDLLAHVGRTSLDGPQALVCPVISRWPLPRRWSNRLCVLVIDESDIKIFDPRGISISATNARTFNGLGVGQVMLTGNLLQHVYDCASKDLEPIRSELKRIAVGTAEIDH